VALWLVETSNGKPTKNLWDLRLKKDVTCFEALTHKCVLQIPFFLFTMLFLLEEKKKKDKNCYLEMVNS
jgi:hypothetical protein